MAGAAAWPKGRQGVHEVQPGGNSLGELHGGERPLQGCLAWECFHQGTPESAEEL